MTAQASKQLAEICRIIDKTVAVEKIYLFGSYAYGVPNQDSDYDICVILPDEGIRPADAVKKIRRALYASQTVPLDVIACRSEEFLRRQGGASLERKIMREGVLLHERRRIESGMA